MKYLILLCLLCLMIEASSQVQITPSPLRTLEARVNDEGVEIGDFYSFADVKLTDVNQIVYVTQYIPQFTPNPDGLGSYELLDGEFFKLTMMDTALNKIYEWRSGVFNDSTLSPGLVQYIGQENDRIKLLGTGRNDSLALGGISFFEFTFDMSLNLLDEVWFNLSLPLDISIISSAIKNKEGNYVMTGFLTNPTSTSLEDREVFYCEFTEEGTVLKLTSPSQDPPSSLWLNDNEAVQLDNGNYIVHPFYILDEDFNELAYYDDPRLILSGRIFPIDSTRFVYGGTGLAQVNNTIDGVHNFEALCVGNTNGEVDTIYYNSVQNINLQWMPGIKAISAIDTNHIYFATNRDGFFLSENTNVALHSVSINGTINWSYYFGGDASYTPIDIVTMPDGGCLVLVWKLSRDNPLEQWKSDIDYVRFDVDGNLYDLTTSLTDTNFKVLSALVYPNPTSYELYIEYGEQLKDIRIEMVNAAGIEVLSEKVIRQEAIDLRSLSSGIYFYRLFEGNDFIQSGKIVVEK